MSPRRRRRGGPLTSDVALHPFDGRSIPAGVLSHAPRLHADPPRRGVSDPDHARAARPDDARAGRRRLLRRPLASFPALPPDVAPPEHPRPRLGLLRLFRGLSIILAAPPRRPARRPRRARSRRSSSRSNRSAPPRARARPRSRRATRSASSSAASTTTAPSSGSPSPSRSSRDRTGCGTSTGGRSPETPRCFRGVVSGTAWAPGRGAGAGPTDPAGGDAAPTLGTRRGGTGESRTVGRVDVRTPGPR